MYLNWVVDSPVGDIFPYHLPNRDLGGRRSGSSSKVSKDVTYICMHVIYIYIICIYAYYYIIYYIIYYVILYYIILYIILYYIILYYIILYTYSILFIMFYLSASLSIRQFICHPYTKHHRWSQPARIGATWPLRPEDAETSKAVMGRLKMAACPKRHVWIEKTGEARKSCNYDHLWSAHKYWLSC